MIQPVCYIIAGPNGAGKTTFAKEFLPNEAACPLFVNADLIAEGLSPFTPETANFHAGRLMLSEIERHVQSRENFAFETTLAGRIYARKIPAWQNIGYRVRLIFLSLSSVEEAVERVAIRVKQGGHNVPDTVLCRRFYQGWVNFENVYKSLVDAWVVYDNSGDNPKLIDEGINS